MENLVLAIMKENPSTRNDDYLLMWAVCDRLKPDVLNKPFGFAIANHIELGLPNWKTVERCRRKVQEKYPNLQATKTKQQQRKNEEKEYIDYARGENENC